MGQKSTILNSIPCNVGMINWGKDGDVSSVMGKKRYLRKKALRWKERR
jgi:hypothetical protein